MHPRARRRWTGERYVDPLAVGLVGRKSAPEMAAIAEHLVRAWDASAPWREDLRQQLQLLVTLIHRANA